MKIAQNPYSVAPTPARPDTEKPDRYVAQAEELGTRFYERKRFHLPWTEPTRELKTHQVLDKLPNGRVEATSSEGTIKLDSVQDLQDLVALQRNETGKAQAIHALEQEGWRFFDQGQEVGAFGAYQGPVTAKNGDRLAQTDDPEALSKFYDPKSPAKAAQLEEAGYSFFDKEDQRIPAFNVTPEARVGKEHGWLRLEESDQQSLESFQALLEASTSVDQARLAFPLLEHMDLEAALLALQVQQATKQKSLFEHFTQYPPPIADPVALEQYAQGFAREAQPAFLERMLALPTQVDSLSKQALRTGDLDLQRQALDKLGELNPELQKRLDNWGPVLQSHNGKQLLHKYLLQNPELKTDQVPSLADAILSDMAYYTDAKQERPKLAAAYLRELLSQPILDAQQVARQGLTASNVGAQIAAREALDKLGELNPELKKRLDRWGPVLQSHNGKQLLHKYLLQNPELKPDQVQSLADAILSDMAYYGDAKQERPKLAAAYLRELLSQPTFDVEQVARQGLTASNVGEQTAAREALDKLGELNPELQKRLDNWGPVLQSHNGKQLLHKYLLQNPQLEPDQVQSLADAIVSDMAYYADARQERPKLAAAYLRELLSQPRPDVRQLARQGLNASNVGEQTAAREALDKLGQLNPELKKRLDLWSPLLQSGNGKQILHKHLLQVPELKPDQVQGLAYAILSDMGYYNDSKQERPKFVAACLREMLSEPTLDVQGVARQGLAAINVGEHQAAREALDRIGQENPEIRKRLDHWDPALQCRNSKQLLHKYLLQYPDLKPDQVQNLADAILNDMAYYADAKQERGAFAKACVTEALQTSNVDGIARAGRTSLHLGQPDAAREALDYLGTLPQCEGLSYLWQDWRWPEMTEQAETTLMRMLLANPLAGDDPDTRRELGAEIAGSLGMKEDRDHFQSILASGSIRREVEKLANPEKTTGIAEQDQNVVVGGVVIKKKDP